MWQLSEFRETGWSGLHAYTRVDHGVATRAVHLPTLSISRGWRPTATPTGFFGTVLAPSVTCAAAVWLPMSPTMHKTHVNNASSWLRPRSMRSSVTLSR